MWLVSEIVSCIINIYKTPTSVFNARVQKEGWEEGGGLDAQKILVK